MREEEWEYVLTLQPGCVPAFPREYAGPLFTLVAGAPRRVGRKRIGNRVAML